MAWSREAELAEEAAERERLLALDKETLIRLYFRRKELATTFGLDVQLDAVQYQAKIDAQDMEIRQLRDRCDYLERYQEKAKALVEAHGGSVQ